MTGGGGTVGNAIVDHPDIALITFTGSPDVGWGIRARAPRKKVGLELGNNAPVIIEPDGDWRGRGRQDQGRRLQPRRASRASRRSGSTCIAAIADDFTAALVEQVRSAGRRRPARRGHRRLGADLHGRARAGRVVDRRGGGRRRQGRDRRRGRRRRRARADGAHRRDARHEGVPPGGVRPGRRDRRPTTTSTRRSRLANDTGTGCRPRSSPPTSARRCKAARTLDFGGVLVNEVPTWRADQSPTAACATAATPGRARLLGARR